MTWQEESRARAVFWVGPEMVEALIPLPGGVSIVHMVTRWAEDRPSESQGPRQEG